MFEATEEEQKAERSLLYIGGGLFAAYLGAKILIGVAQNPVAKCVTRHSDKYYAKDKYRHPPSKKLVEAWKNACKRGE